MAKWCKVVDEAGGGSATKGLSCLGLFTYDVSQKWRGPDPPTPLVSQGQKLFYPPSPLVRKNKKKGYPPPLSWPTKIKVHRISLSWYAEWPQRLPKILIVLHEFW